MINFNDHLNFSPNPQDNFYMMRQRALQEALLMEAKKKKKKKEEKKEKEEIADEDYDGDGEVETGSEEFLGSRDKAIKANMAKKNNKSKKPAKKVEKKKKHLKEGNEVQAGNFVYGGFPKILNEVEIRLAEGNANPDEESELAGRPDPHATARFNDADDTGGENIATQPDDLSVEGGMGLKYPSSEYAKVARESSAASETLTDLSSAHRRAKQMAYLKHMAPYEKQGIEAKQKAASDFTWQDSPENIQAISAATESAQAARAAMESHPHHGTFMSDAERHAKLIRGGNFGE